MKKIVIIYSIITLLCSFQLLSHSEISLNPPQDAGMINPLLPGSKVENVLLKTESGEVLDLGELLSEKKTIVVFFRGGWCPYCNLHLNELEQVAPMLKKLGYKLIAISPDTPVNTKLNQKKESLSFLLLSDSDMLASSAFGLTFKVSEKIRSKYKKYGIDLVKASGRKHFLLPVPGVFIMGTDGKVKFSYANPDYRHRLNSRTLLSAARMVDTQEKNGK